MRDFNMQPANIGICSKVVRKCKHEVISSLSQNLFIEKVEFLTDENLIDFEIALNLIEDKDIYDTFSYYVNHNFYNDIIIIKTRNIFSSREFSTHTGEMYEQLEQLYIQTVFL